MLMLTYNMVLELINCFSFGSKLGFLRWGFFSKGRQDLGANGLYRSEIGPRHAKNTGSDSATSNKCLAPPHFFSPFSV